MTWEEKLRAMYALDDETRIQFDAYGQFMCNMPRTVGFGDGFSVGFAHGHASTIETAIEKCWNEITGLRECTHLVLRERGEVSPRRAVKWNGYMWADVYEPAP